MTDWLSVALVCEAVALAFGAGGFFALANHTRHRVERIDARMQRMAERLSAIEGLLQPRRR